MTETTRPFAHLLAAAGSLMLSAATAFGQTTSPGAPAPATTSTASSRAMVERILVRVNGEIFSQGQLTDRQLEELQELKRDSGPTLANSIAEVTPRLLVEAVDELLLVQRGREMGFRFTDDQFKTAVDNIKRDNKLDDEGLKVGLAQAGLTLDLLRQRLERSFLVNAVQQREVGPTLSITNEEIRQRYDKNKTTYMTVPTVTLRELLIVVPTRTEGGKDVFSPFDDAAAKEKVEALRQRAASGENFAQLVRDNSDSSTKTTGGLIGPVNFDDLNPTLKEQVRALPLGGLTPVVRAPRGYQVFQLDNRTEPTQKPFETVRNEIEMAIREERIEPETVKLLTRLRAQAVIEWKDENYRKLYEQELASDKP